MAYGHTAVAEAPRFTYFLDRKLALCMWARRHVRPWNGWGPSWAQVGEKIAQAESSKEIRRGGLRDLSRILRREKDGRTRRGLAGLP